MLGTYSNHRPNDTRYTPIKIWGGLVSTRNQIIVWGFVDPTYPNAIDVVVICY